MATPHEKLSESLEVLRALQKRGIVAVRSGDLTRTHRERLVKNGFLIEVMKGWYIPVRQDDVTGESTAWYASFWGFCAVYLKARFGLNWSLSPEQSLLLHVGNMRVPRQLLVRSPKARNKVTTLPHGTSLFDTRAALPETGQVTEKDGLRLFSVPAGLVSCGAKFFLQNATDARAALAMVRDASDVLALLLEGGRTTVAGRLSGAFRNIGRFLMNVMLAGGGYPWTVIPFEKRDDYMNALESGSVKQDITPFAFFLGRLISERLESK
jgi:hypothetical protein